MCHSYVRTGWLFFWNGRCCKWDLNKRIEDFAMNSSYRFPRSRGDSVSIKLCCIRLHYLLCFSHHKYPIEVQWYRLKSDWKLIFLCFAVFALFCVHGLVLFLILETERKFLMSTTGFPRSLQECGGDSCLHAVLRYRRLVTKGCMGCKWFFKREKKCRVFK